MAGSPDAVRLVERWLELGCVAPQLTHIGEGSSVVLGKAQLLKLLELNPRQGEVGHELLEGPRLLGLPLRV